jgi:hypothetical protein
MAQYIEVDQAIPMSGLRVVFSPGLPGPWSESAKGILHVKRSSGPEVRSCSQALRIQVEACKPEDDSQPSLLTILPRTARETSTLPWIFSSTCETLRNRSI